MAYNTHLVHGRNAAFEAAFHIVEKVFYRGKLGIGVFHRARAHTRRKGGELFFKQVGVVLVLASEYFHQIGQPVAQALDAFFDVVVHNILGPARLDFVGRRNPRNSGRPMGCLPARLPGGGACAPPWPQGSRPRRLRRWPVAGG